MSILEGFGVGYEARLRLRVYYEDVDLAGVVYYANYLRYIERGRSEMLRELGVDQIALRRDEGAVFAVRRCEIDYLRPAKFDDELTIVTRVDRIGGARLDLVQEVTRGEMTEAEILSRARIVIVCVGADGRPRRLPKRFGGATAS